MKCFLGLYGARESRRLGRLGPFYADADSGTRPQRRRICAPCRSQKTWFAHTQCGFHAVCQNNFRQIFCRSCCAIEIRCWARKCQKSESSPKIFFFFFSPFFFLPELDRVGFPPKRRRNPGRDGVVVGGSNPEGAGRTAVRGEREGTKRQAAESRGPQGGGLDKGLSESSGYTGLACDPQSRPAARTQALRGGLTEAAGVSPGLPREKEAKPRGLLVRRKWPRLER